MRSQTVSSALIYLQSLIAPDNEWAQKAKDEAQRINKEGISISSYEAHLMSFFIRQYQCARFVEFGTLTGYSGLKILESLPPEGHLWTFELKEECAAFAASLFDKAGYRGRYTILVGRAEEQLPKLAALGPFDGVFIDANKSAYPFYLDWALQSLKVGGLILADNVLLRGVVPEDLFFESDKATPKMIRSLREFNQKIMDHKFFDSMILPTAEGLAIAIKK